MAEITYRKVNDHAWANDTWLMPYRGRVVKIVKYKSGRIDLWLDGHKYMNCEGAYTAHNGWNFTTLKLLSRPLRITESQYQKQYS